MYRTCTLADHLSLGSSMVRASYRSSEGCEFDPRLGLRIIFWVSSLKVVHLPWRLIPCHSNFKTSSAPCSLIVTKLWLIYGKIAINLSSHILWISSISSCTLFWSILSILISSVLRNLNCQIKNKTVYQSLPSLSHFFVPLFSTFPFHSPNQAISWSKYLAQ